MALIPLTLDTIGDLNGGAARIIVDRAIAAAIADLEDRGPEDDKPRQVIITLEVALIGDDNVGANVRVKWRAPEYRTAATVACMQRTPDGTELLFQDQNPQRVDQGTFPSLDTEVEE